MTMMIRAQVKNEHVADTEDAAKTMFAALSQAQPQGVRYTSYRLADTGTFIILLELQNEAENPLPGVAAFRAFQGNLKEWLAGPAIPQQLTTVGDYRSF